MDGQPQKHNDVELLPCSDPIHSPASLVRFCPIVLIPSITGCRAPRYSECCKPHNHGDKVPGLARLGKSVDIPSCHWQGQDVALLTSGDRQNSRWQKLEVVNHFKDGTVCQRGHEWHRGQCAGNSRQAHSWGPTKPSPAVATVAAAAR